MFSLKGKIAIVTGGSKGIGRSIVIALAKLGAKTVIADIDEEKGKELEGKLLNCGLEAEYMYADVLSSSSVCRIVEGIIEKYGRIDIFVNNAGILHDAFITDISDDLWDQVISVNLRGVFYCCRAIIPYMIKQRCGKIINIASTGGKMGFPYAGVHYCASKGGVMALTRQLALQVSGFCLNINAVAPGTIETELIKSRDEEIRKAIVSKIPLGKMGRPEDVAAVVVFLASAGSDYITGETIDINGGLHMD